MFANYKKKLIFFQTILISLIPAALITGPFLPDLFFSLSGLIFIFIIIKEKEFFNLFKSKLFILFFLWCVYFIFTSLISKDPFFSLESSLFYFRFGLGALSVAYIIEKNENFFKYFISILLLTLFILCVFSYFQFFNEINLNVIGNENRLSGLFGDDKKMGSYILRLLPILVYITLFQFSFNKYNIHKKIFIIFFIIMSLNLIFLSAERNAILLSIIYISLFTLFVNKNKFVFFIITSILILFLINMFQNDFLRFKDIKFDVFSKNKIIINDQYTAHFSTALNIFYDNPIFGTGPKTFRIECSNPKYRTVYGTNYADNRDSNSEPISDYKEYDGCSTHPHSTYLQLLSETGLIGTLPLVYIFLLMNYHLFIFIFGFKSILYPKAIPLILLLYINIFPFSPSGNFFGNWLSVIVYLGIGFLLSVLSEKKYKKNFFTSSN